MPGKYGWCVTGLSSANAAVTATKAAPAASDNHLVRGVDAAFSANPAAFASIQIKDGDNNVLWQGYVSGTQFKRTFKNGVYVPAGKAVSATLAAGGAGVIGAVNLDGVTV